MEMSGLDDILEMDWIMADRVIIGRDCRRVTAYAHDGVYVMFQGDKHDALPQTVPNFGCYRRLMGWLVSLTREDEARPGLGLPQVVESKGMFF